MVRIWVIFPDKPGLIIYKLLEKKPLVFFLHKHYYITLIHICVILKSPSFICKFS